MGAAERLGHNLVHDAKGQQVRSGEAQRLSRLRGLVAGAPEDRGASLRGDDGVVGVFEHEEAVAGSESERAAAAALADHHAEERRAKARHLHQVHGDRLGHAAFLRADPGVGAHGVNECHDRQMVFLGELHHAERLPVAFRMRHAEVARELLLRRAALLLADEDDLLPVQAREPGHNRVVVAEPAVAVEIYEVLEDLLHMHHARRAGGMASKAHAIPRGQVGENFLGELRLAPFEFADIELVVHALGFGLRPEQFNLVLDLANRLFKRQGELFHFGSRPGQ